jgi:hypothetical protein
MIDGNMYFKNLETSNFRVAYSDVIFILNSVETYQYVQYLFVCNRLKFMFAYK